MKYLFIAVMLMMFNPVASAFDGHEKYEGMSYEELMKIDKKSLKGKDKAAYMKALNKAKKGHKSTMKTHAKRHERRHGACQGSGRQDESCRP